MATSEENIPKWIAFSDDKDALERVAIKAETVGRSDIKLAALARSLQITGLDIQSPLDRDVARMISAYEYFLREKNGRKQRSRARDKIKNRGVAGALEHWALNSKSTEGFDQLVAAGLAYYAGESVILRHKSHFSEDVIAKAKQRLIDAGINVESVEI